MPKLHFALFDGVQVDLVKSVFQSLLGSRYSVALTNCPGTGLLATVHAERIAYQKAEEMGE